MQSQFQQSARAMGLFVLRLGMGGFMLTHGWPKLQLLMAREFDKFPDPIGLGSGWSLVLVVAAEFFCSLLIVAGLATRLAAVPVVVAMAVAAFVAHAADPWTMGEGARLFKAGEAQSWASKEPALLFLTGFLTLVFTGPGCLSLDALLWSRWRRAKEPPAEASTGKGS
jgi:putative oxidoreductase